MLHLGILLRRLRPFGEARRRHNLAREGRVRSEPDTLDGVRYHLAVTRLERSVPRSVPWRKASGSG
jgi:hypothetical protein